MKSKEFNKTIMEQSEFDEAFYEALKKFGYLFPETEEELELAKQRISKEKVELPDDLKDPLEIIKRGKITFLSEFHSSEDQEIEENLAMAAREGANEITDETWEQMEKDRKAAEEKVKKNNAD